MAEPLDENPSRVILSDIALLGATAFNNTAFTADELERRFASPTPETARDFVVLRTIADVQRYGVSAHRWSTVESRLRLDDPYDAIEGDSLFVEKVAWQRRLLEALVTLINFSTTNDNEYFSHYLAVYELERRRYLASDERDFFGAESELTKQNISILKRHVDAARSKLMESADCWYLKSNEQYRPASARSQYVRALNIARATERTALGYTYHHSFGAASERLHFGVLDAQGGELSADRAAAASCGLVALGIVARAHELCNVEPTGINKYIVSKARNTRPSEFLAPSVDPGDFVLTTGPHIAEICEVRTTAFGYASYRVRFLDVNSGPGIEEDWLPALAVRPFMTRKEIVEGIRTRFAEHPIPGFVMSDDDIAVSAREAAVEAWRLGLRAFVVRQMEEEEQLGRKRRAQKSRGAANDVDDSKEPPSSS